MLGRDPRLSIALEQVRLDVAELRAIGGPYFSSLTTGNC